jgi:CobQ-like glutamine amidotransferase family enzyme
MYLVRDTFNCKPGKAKELVKKFKQTIPFMEVQHLKNVRIMTDVVSNYWTVVLEGEVENLAAFENHRGFTSQEKVKEIMASYMDLVGGGKREIFQIE